VGIGRPATQDAVVDWVLTGFPRDERAALPGVVEAAAEAALALVGAARDP
jgi:peptidyl-tRNA hydrolase